MSRADLTALSERELVVQENDVTQRLAGTRLKHALGQLEQNSEIRGLRRERARLLTEMRRREIEAGLPKGALAQRHASALGASASKVSETVGESVQKKPEGLLASLRRRLTGGGDEG